MELILVKGLGAVILADYIKIDPTEIGKEKCQVQSFVLNSISSFNHILIHLCPILPLTALNLYIHSLPNQRLKNSKLASGWSYGTICPAP